MPRRAPTLVPRAAPCEPVGARDRLILALDEPDLTAAKALARRLEPYFATVKVGLELYSAAGPRAVVELVEDGFAVFVDVKLHDIPTTVGRAARVLGALGASFVTLHVAGGADMLAAGVGGLIEGAEQAGLPAPVALGVTVLTSAADAPTALVASRAELAAAAGCRGVVCAASDLRVILQSTPGMLKVTPGIRAAGSGLDDQARVATAAQALRAGADLLVVGRAVTGAADQAAAAAALVKEVDAATG